tara:strand:- start:391 stop:516 length:126 start_codon:yes stop_codon:yes gene_type:complete
VSKVIVVWATNKFEKNIRENKIIKNILFVFEKKSINILQFV